MSRDARLCFRTELININEFGSVSQRATSKQGKKNIEPKTNKTNSCQQRQQLHSCKLQVPPGSKWSRIAPLWNGHDFVRALCWLPFYCQILHMKTCVARTLHTPRRTHSHIHKHLASSSALARCFVRSLSKLLNFIMFPKWAWKWWPYLDNPWWSAEDVQWYWRALEKLETLAREWSMKPRNVFFSLRTITLNASSCSAQVKRP